MSTNPQPDNSPSHNEPATTENEQPTAIVGLRKTERSQALRSLIIPLLAVFTALIIAGVIVVVTDPQVIQAFTHQERFIVAPDRQIALGEASDIFSRAPIAAGNIISLHPGSANAPTQARLVVVEGVTQDLSELAFDGTRALSLQQVTGRQVQVGDTIALPGIWEVMIVEEVTSRRTQINLETARQYFPKAQPGDVLLAATKDRRRTVVQNVTDEDTEISLEEARDLYPSIGPGVAIVQNFFDNPAVGLRTVGQTLKLTYVSLFEGSFGSPKAIIEGFQTWLNEDNPRPLYSALRPLSESLVNSIPYILAGLAVALGFRAGLFNIGAEGQLIIGGLATAFVGYAVTGLPALIHIPLALGAGILAAGIWGGIPGFLKARVGAHEVINTIMFNYIAFRLADWLLNGPMEYVEGTARTKEIAPTAILPRFLPHPIRFNWGFFIAIAAAVFVWWLLWKTVWGFELRTVGANPSAARYGGMSVARNYILAMFLSGGLAGLAGSVQVMGITYNIALGFSAGYGFDSIALALLGKSHPLGVTVAALLFGFLRAGGTRMQSIASIPIEIVSIVQAMVIIFIAAPAIVRAIYRLRERETDEGQIVFSRGWGA
jgi:simple sugar transport system permease protein